MSIVSVAHAQTVQNREEVNRSVYGFLTEPGNLELSEDLNLVDAIGELSDSEIAQLYAIANYNRLRTHMDDNLWANAYINEEDNLVVWLVEDRSEEAIRMIEDIPMINAESLLFEYTNYSRHDLIAITEFLADNAEALQIYAVAFTNQPIVYVNSSRARNFSPAIIEAVLANDLPDVSLDAIKNISFIVNDHSLEILGTPELLEGAPYADALDFEAYESIDSALDTRNTVHTINETVMINNGRWDASIAWGVGGNGTDMWSTGHSFRVGDRIRHNGREIGTVVGNRFDGSGDSSRIMLDNNVRFNWHTVNSWSGGVLPVGATVTTYGASTGFQRNARVVLNNFEYRGNNHHNGNLWWPLYVTNTRSVDRDSGGSMFQSSGSFNTAFGIAHASFGIETVFTRASNRAWSERHTPPRS